MPALHNALDKFLPVNLWNDFHGGQPFLGMCDVRTQQILLIGEYLAAFTTPRDADVELFLMDTGQRSGRSHHDRFVRHLHDRGRLRLVTWNVRNDFASPILFIRCRGRK